MPFIALRFKPGINRDQTNYSNEGGWFEGDKIRFLSGYPQKIGGWLKQTPNTFLGTCRQLFNYVTTFGDNLLAVGTNLKLYIEAGGYFYDITPLQSTTAAGDVTFAAVNGSSTVTVSDTSNPAVAGNYVQFTGAVSLGGNVTAAILNVNQGFEIATVVNANAYTIVVPVTANASDAGNGGSATVGKYQINVGTPGGTFGYGWGTDTWGRLEWGLGGTIPVALQGNDWWYDNFDNDLVANIRDGAIYYWERGSSTNPGVALDTNAILLSVKATADGYNANAVPTKAMQVLVSQNDKHLLAFGSVPFGSTNVADFDPLLIRWADQDNPGQWTPTPTNSAGFIRVSRGSRIVRALPTRQEILVWTESHLYSFQYLGTTDVFGLQELADNISILSPRACVTVNNVTYWMGTEKFYAYSGRVETLPCTLRQFIFQDINFGQADTIISGSNEGWNEVWWIYPSSSSSYPNRYVIYNYLERIWYYGNIDRTAWLDSPLREYPMAVNTPGGTSTGVLYDQENGLDDDGAPITAYIQSSDFDIADGEQFMLTRRMLPDINFSNSTAAAPEVTLQIRPRNFPGSGFQPVGTTDSKPVIETAVDVYTDQVFIRARARQMALKISSEDLGVNWQLGVPRLDARVDGKR
jgi:hypothetical protein